MIFVVALKNYEILKILETKKVKNNLNSDPKKPQNSL